MGLEAVLKVRPVHRVGSVRLLQLDRYRGTLARVQLGGSVRFALQPLMKPLTPACRPPPRTA